MIEKKINPSGVPVCDLLTATLQFTDRHKRKIMQLCLWHVLIYQSAKNWYKKSQHSVTRTFLSQRFVFAFAFP